VDLPLGIDLIEFKKAKSFYRAHRDALSSFFSIEETGYIRQSPKPHECLALLLSAKEAVFKTLSAPWMGPTGFRNIQIVPRGDGEFSFKLKGPLKKFSSKQSTSKIAFIKRRKYVLAHCRPAVFSSCAGI
jgi:phosphopantetheine--protein transferase-like protein